MEQQHPEEEIGSTEQQQQPIVVHHPGGFEITIKPSETTAVTTTATTATTAASTPENTSSPLKSIITVPSNNNNNPSSNDQIQDPTSTSIDTTLGKGIQSSFTAASNLSNFLPTGTNLVFSAILPTIYKSGQCSSLSTTMMIIVLCLCVLLCFLSSFTDSFELSDRKGKKTIFYGFVTPKGLWVHHYPKGVIEDDKYKLGFGDVLHAAMSAGTFLAIAFSDNRVIDCLFPGHVEDAEHVMQSLVLVVGVVCSSLFLLFPVHRRGFVPSLPKNNSSS